MNILRLFGPFTFAPYCMLACVPPKPPPAMLLYAGPRLSNDAVLTVEDVHFEKITLDGEPLELPTIKQFPFNVGLKPGRYSFLTSCNKKTPIVLDVTPKHEYTLGDALSGGPRIVDAGAGKMLAIVDFECVLMDQTTQATIVRMPAELRDEAPAPQAPASNQPPTSPPP